VVFFFRTDAGPPTGGISNPHPHPQYAGAGADPPTCEISDPHPNSSGLKSADTRIRGWNCHPYDQPCVSQMITLHVSDSMAIHPGPSFRGCSAGLSSASLGLSWLISSHTTLFILPAEHYSFYQPNSPFGLVSKPLAG